MDVNIGKIVATLDKEGLSKNRIFIFLSDNGGLVNSNASVNTPFKGQKGILSEGVIRTPFIIKRKNNFPEKLKYQKPVSSLDITPTVLSLAGLKFENKNNFDGANLTPHILNLNKEAPHKTLK